MKYEVNMNMKNENALCTISMLSALLEKDGGDYYSLLMPFLLYSLPEKKDDEISLAGVTRAMISFGFSEFPIRLTEKLLDRLCQKSKDGKTYVRKIILRGKKKYFVVDSYDRVEFTCSKDEMQRKIERILLAIQDFFKTRFYCKTLSVDDIRDKLTRFFGQNGFTVIKSIQDLKLISKEHGSDSFEIAHFILSEYEKKSRIYDDLCDVTKGFLTFKGLYYFLTEQKNHVDSKFKNVTFYLDCSLVMDALDYDTTSDYNAIIELIRLIRRCGGQVAVFRHTTEEAAKLIEAFASQPHNKNRFRLDNLAEKELPKELLLTVARDIPNTLRQKVQVETVNSPSFSDASNYKNVLGEEEIVAWFLRNRTNGSTSDSDTERYIFDAKSLIAIGMCRRDAHPHYIEQAKAMIVTQDPWLNRCLKDLYREQFKNEVYYAITDTELVSLLWLREHKQVTSLPSDVLIANAYAACRVSTDVMDRAIQLANAMAESGIIPSDAALLVSSNLEFKGFVAERFRNDISRVSDDAIRSAVDDYIGRKYSEKIDMARNEERNQASKVIDEQIAKHASENSAMQLQLDKKDGEIEKLTAELKRKEELEERRKQEIYDRAERIGRRAAKYTYTILYGLLVLCAIAVIAIFGIKCYHSYTDEKAWIPYLIVEVVAFVSVPFLFISKESVCYKMVSRISDWIYSRVYSRIIKKQM